MDKPTSVDGKSTSMILLPTPYSHYQWYYDLYLQLSFFSKLNLETNISKTVCSKGDCHETLLRKWGEPHTMCVFVHVCILLSPAKGITV